MIEFFGGIISYLLIAFIFVGVIVGRCFCNPFFDAILVLGIGWLIFSIIHQKELAEEKKKSFKFIRLIVRIIFWCVLIAVGIIVNIIAGPIRFM